MTKSVGTAVPRIDGAAKVTGSAQYAGDHSAKLYAVCVTSTVAAGQIREIQTGQAEAAEGVRGVFTHENTASTLGWRARRDAFRLSGDGLGEEALRSGAAGGPDGYLPLTSSEIFFAGQFVAVVVAASLEQAEFAAGLIEVNYDSVDTTLAFDFDGPDHIIPGPFFGEEMQVLHQSDAATKSTTHIIDQIYTTSALNHHPMEPWSAVAHWDGETLVLHDSTQGVLGVRSYVAAALGISPDQVRVLSPYVGGGFGCKNQPWPQQALVASLARYFQSSVCLTLSRADMATSCGFRSETRQRMVLHADEQGHLTALQHVTAVPTSMVGNFFEPCGLGSLMLYKTPRLQVTHQVSRRNIPTPTVMRAPGEAAGSFSIESAMDELAYELKLDPLEIRRRNHASHDFFHDREWSSKNLLECYELGAQRFGWPGQFQEPCSFKLGHESIGYGMATTAYPAVALPARVRVNLLGNGQVSVATAAHDIGTGLYTVLAQVVADELSMDVANVRVRLGDSNDPIAPAAGRSKSTASVAPAAAAAARALRQKLLRIAACDKNSPLYRCEQASLELDEGHIVDTNDSARHLSLSELCKFADVTELEATEGGEHASDKTGRSYFSFGAHFVEVRIDQDLGRIRVTRVVSVFDCGQIINTRTAQSQIEGSILFGIGMALTEATTFDPIFSRITNGNLGDYHLPVNADVPEIEVHFVQNPDYQMNALGVRGLGEIGVPGLAAAVANAVFMATGKRIRQLPITAAHILPT